MTWVRVIDQLYQDYRLGHIRACCWGMIKEAIHSTTSSNSWIRQAVMSAIAEGHYEQWEAVDQLISDLSLSDPDATASSGSRRASRRPPKSQQPTRL